MAFPLAAGSFPAVGLADGPISIIRFAMPRAAGKLGAAERDERIVGQGRAVRPVDGGSPEEGLEQLARPCAPAGRG